MCDQGHSRKLLQPVLDEIFDLLSDAFRMPAQIAAKWWRKIAHGFYEPIDIIRLAYSFRIEMAAFSESRQMPLSLDFISDAILSMRQSPLPNDKLVVTGLHQASYYDSWKSKQRSNVKNRHIGELCALPQLRTFHMIQLFSSGKMSRISENSLSVQELGMWNCHFEEHVEAELLLGTRELRRVWYMKEGAVDGQRILNLLRKRPNNMEEIRLPIYLVDCRRGLHMFERLKIFGHLIFDEKDRLEDFVASLPSSLCDLYCKYEPWLEIEEIRTVGNLLKHPKRPPCIELETSVTLSGDLSSYPGFRTRPADSTNWQSHFAETLEQARLSVRRSTDLSESCNDRALYPSKVNHAYPSSRRKRLERQASARKRLRLRK